MKKLATLALALTLLGTLAGCGKGSRATAPLPAPGASSGPKDKGEAQQLAQQSASMAVSYVAQVKSLIGVAMVPGSKPAHVRPANATAGAADTSSWTYSFQGFDVSGAPVDWITQADQVASLGIDYTWYYRTVGDSLFLEDDIRSHSRIDGLQAAATRYVANATDTMSVRYNGYSSGYHWVYDYDGRSLFTNVAWEKSGTPAYPVAGTISMHWHYQYEYWYGGQHGAGDIESDVAITFNGTRYATAVCGSWTFIVDLETGTVS